MRFLLDSGSSVNLFHSTHLSPGVKLQVPRIVVSTLGGKRVPLRGIARKVQLQNGLATLGQVNFLVTDEKMKGFDGILGAPFLNQSKVSLNFKSSTMTVSNHMVRFSNKTHANLCNCTEIELQDELNVLEGYANWTETVNKDNVILRNSENLEFPAWHVGMLKVYCPDEYANELLLVEPHSLPNSLVLGGAVIKPDKHSYVPVMNLSQAPVKLERGALVAHAALIEDPRLIIGLEEEFTEEQYVNYVSHRDQQGVQEGTSQGIPEGMSLNLRASGNAPQSISRDMARGSPLGKREQGVRPCGKVQRSPQEIPEKRQKVSGRHSYQKDMLDNPEGLKERAPSHGDLLKDLEFEQMDRLPAMKEKHLKDDKYVKKMIDSLMKECECPPALESKLRAMLWKYRDVLAEKEDPVGLCTAYKPRIPLDTTEPVYTPQYPVPFKMREAMREAIKEFLKMGVVVPSTSPYNSPSLMVPKRDGGFRLVVDFRRLNKHVITDPHPLPRIAQIMETLGEAQVLSALDLLHGFYNLEVHPEDRKKTAFSTYDGHWEFIRLPMGLKNSPSIFQRLMQIVLSGCLGHHAFIYIDDILVFSKNPEEHLKHLEDVFSRLSSAGLKIKASKCQLFRSEVEYLGYLAGNQGLKVNPRQYTPLREFKRPVNVKGVLAFLGFVGYFRQFVSNFAARARPLYQLVKKDQEWKWGPEQEEAFQDLKKCLFTAPAIAFPKWNQEFILVTDASGYAVSAVLTQIQKGKERLIGCASRVLTKSERNYSNTDREYLAVVYGVTNFRSLLWGNKFKIYTDNSAVSAIARQDKTTTSRAVRWYNLLHEYDFTIEHRAATTMKHVDALSRYLPETAEKKPVSVHNFEFSSQVPNGVLHYLSPSWQQGDSFVPIFELERWEYAMKKDKFPPAFSPESKYELIIEDSLAYRQVKGEPENRQLWVPPSLRRHVMQLYHDPPSVGHIGTRKMMATMTPMVWWSGMSSDVDNYCKTCLKCQQYKTHAARVPTSSKPIPAKCLEDVSLDLIGPVPSAWRGTRYILCIQDRLSRFLVFAPMASGHAEVVARTFLTSWVCQYGAPKRLVTDRGKNLVGAVFKRLCEFLGTKHTPTCTYRPQGNAQNERAHKELHQYIAMYLSEATNAANWDLLLNHAAWVHNSSYHTVLKRSPLEVLTGVKPRNGADFLPGNHPDRESRDLTFEEYYAMKSEQLQNLQEQARLAIAKAQAVTRENLNKHARVPNYKVGDEVWVKTHGVKTIDSKWAKRYEGPWVVKEVISPQVLKLVQKDDPSKIDIVHTTYIRKKYDRVETSDDSDSEGDDSDSDARSDYLDYSDDDSDHGDNSSNSPQRPRVVPTGPRPNSESRRTNINHSPPQKPSTSSTPSWWPDPLKRIVKALSPSKNTSAQNDTILLQFLFLHLFLLLPKLLLVCLEMIHQIQRNPLTRKFLPRLRRKIQNQLKRVQSRLTRLQRNSKLLASLRSQPHQRLVKIFCFK
jgi:hypothetical protein